MNLLSKFLESFDDEGLMFEVLAITNSK